LDIEGLNETETGTETPTDSEILPETNINTEAYIHF
jgi:hypothetical protein